MSKKTAPGGGPAASDPSDRLPPIWVGDHLALDFLNSTATPRGTPIEWIANGQALVTWLTDAKALDPSDAKRIRTQFSARDLDQTARDGVALREWFREVLVRAKARGVASLPCADIDRLNGVMTRGTAYRRIEKQRADGQLHLVDRRAWRTAGDLLVPVATAMADILCDSDLDLVRNCENPPCTMWFYDRTKGHRRRWCSQAICGNRAKVAAFRSRQKQNKVPH
ncbi:MAG: CGNR zinc finger domain-containing protein [Proteobacteria bacterium]|nr:CGNR zinc finger domain-containing protein [Pseudomonadota bacterium]